MESNQIIAIDRTNLEPTDSCGVGFVANIKNAASNRVLKLATTALKNVLHRGAVAADGKSGDGCGILTTVPQKMLRNWLVDAAIDPGSELVGVATVFLPQETTANADALTFISNTIQSLGLRVVSVRNVPVNLECLGASAQKNRPDVVQIFVTGATSDADVFERKLFIARRSIELSPLFSEFAGLHVASFSARTLVYKAMVQSSELANFYPDLRDPDFECSVCVYHQRFSTNTSPSWALCQPFRMAAHNGEINTIRGNRNWMTARESSFNHEYWNEYRSLVTRLFNYTDSDSASLDNCVELLTLSGRSIPHALSMLIPPAWKNDPRITAEQKAFYEFHSCFCEPWDGPAAVIAFDGKLATAALDRNGLRPLRYKTTKDGLLIVGSEVGAEREPLENIASFGRLGPGQTIAFDLENQNVSFDHQVKQQLAGQSPYAEWLDQNRLEFHPEIDSKSENFDSESTSFLRQQIAAGIREEEIEISLRSMASDGKEPTFSMGVDTPLAVLSQHPRHIADYFKQRFAQVTNPPIDPVRERLGMSLAAGLGPERNILGETPMHCRIMSLENPILLPSEFQQLIGQAPFPMLNLDCTWDREQGPKGLEDAIDRLVAEARLAVDNQNVILVLSDRAVSQSRVAIPMLMAVGAIHHGLNKTGQRMMCSLIAETSEVRDSHQLALLFGYGCTAVYPYLAFGSIERSHGSKPLGNENIKEYWIRYRNALSNGILKIMSKMGISVLYSYQGAQIFESIGVGPDVIEKCFKRSFTNLGGNNFEDFAQDCLNRHDAAYRNPVEDLAIMQLGISKPKRSGEHHVINGKVTKSFHQFVRENESDQYRDFRSHVNSDNPVSIRDLFKLSSTQPSVSTESVEPASSIVRRFTTAAMSLGAISPEAHEALAIAMNEIGAKSNSGEGGEDSRRFRPNADGTNSNSRIKQVASGRFGVSIDYFQSADEIEIKMAQGAKPGEGGQLPGFKVNALIARLRHTSPGVTLISPPPHHDIYSIEDLSQLIYDLKVANPYARVCVKLVSKSGVGGIAVGVAKANADVVLISGHEGGTGASPLTSIRHAGMPWELGLAETHQNLIASDLRDKLIVRADGGMRTGVDVIKAAMLGAEEYNFGTMALIALGCVYVKKCHLNNCPVGIATQDPKYREKFKGKPENLVNYLTAVAEECRTLLANLGYRNMDSIIGKTNLLEQIVSPTSNRITLNSILNFDAHQSKCLKTTAAKYAAPPIRVPAFDDRFVEQMDWEASNNEIRADVVNTDRNIGTGLSGEIARRFDANENFSVTYQLNGSAGQSMGAFLCDGITIVLTGESNDYVAKGMSGGEIVIRSPIPKSETKPVLAGNAILYGATGGKLFVGGQVAERFCVRNSGAISVIEGCGDHGCEYMTRGTAVILGPVGNNFGAGMTGGIAFVLDQDQKLANLCNLETVTITEPDLEQLDELQILVEEFNQKTGSEIAKTLLNRWQEKRGWIKCVIPKGNKPSPAAQKNSNAAIAKNE